jgi:Bacterial Ig domain
VLTTERLVRVALALALACGAVLTGSAAAARAAVPPAAAKHLELTPAAAVAQVGEPIRYVAEAVDDNGDRENLTPLTAFRFNDPAACRQSQDPATRGEVTCFKPGKYRIAGDVDVPPLTSAPVDLEVVEEAVSPRIESVDRSPTPPNRDLTVTGSTGTCEHMGTLSLVGTNSSKAVAGKFTTTLPVPPGIVPRGYELLLTVLCNRDRQEDRFKLVVENQPPTPGNDEASTVPGKPVTIPVAGNDTDPDDPDGYGTRLEEASPGPSHGTVAVQGDQIVYSPDGTFDSRGDSFTYASCDVIGRRALACGSATVTVARKPPTPHNDEARTEQGKAVSIPVTGNDDDPDDTLLHVSRDPKEPGATAVVDRNHPGSIEYAPAGTLIGDDTFEYDYCPIVINAAAPSACKSATVTVHVERRPVPPRIDSVADDPTPPNREVTVKGTTGTCDPAATLTLNSQPKAASGAVTGGQDGTFAVKLKVPPGTFIDSYQLTLRAACDGSPVAVERELKVVNQRPDAVEDRVTIDSTAGVRVPIKVLDNDTDPDDPDGYATRLTIERDPAHGTAQVRSDQTAIDYTPDEGFKDVGEDRFTYAYCDVVGPRRATECDTATVTVTKLPPRRSTIPASPPSRTTPS